MGDIIFPGEKYRGGVPSYWRRKYVTEGEKILKMASVIKVFPYHRYVQEHHCPASTIPARK